MGCGNPATVSSDLLALRVWQNVAFDKDVFRRGLCAIISVLADGGYEGHRTRREIDKYARLACDATAIACPENKFPDVPLAPSI